MEKIDLKKQLKHLYQLTHKEFTVVDVPPLKFLIIDGKGNPNTSQDFQEAMQALYGMSYTLKFASKKELGIDYTVMALEGLWWADDMKAFTLGAKDTWYWTAMMLQPDRITPECVEAARERLARKKDVPALPRLRYETFHEGLSVQIMYFGPYADEGPTIARMHAFMQDNGYTFNGKHHEIYIGDPRTAAPEKLKTMIRQPVKKA
ncbi:MAG: GyrI-like domain-containing protein [Anaerolineae bacterium]|nr:GyrI-like domain-containing protein [Anaerolineae bacterium]